MKVVDVYVSEDGLEAVVTLQPHWLARLFGARPLRVFLAKDPKAGIDRWVWRSAITRRPLDEMAHGLEIRAALEAQPEGRRYLPRARIVT